MHVIRADYTLRTTYAVEFQRQNDRRTHWLAQQPGFMGYLLLNSLGYPVMQMSPMYFHNTRYVLLTGWRSEDDADACFGSAEWEEFTGEYASERLFASPESLRRYRTHDEQRIPLDSAPFGWLIALNVEDTTAERIEATRLALSGLDGVYREQLPGFVESSLIEDLDAPGQLLNVLLLAGQTTFPPGDEVAGIRDFYRQGFPAGIGADDFEPEAFQVVSRLHLSDALSPG